MNRLKSLYKPQPPQEVESGSAATSGGYDNIPDGQEVLLQPSLGYAFQFVDNIYGLKENGRIYLSFPDFVGVLYFPITYDAQTHNASGWFLREDWDFTLDYAARQATAQGQTYTIEPQDTLIRDDELLVNTDTLSQWFGIGIEPDLARQVLALESDYPFPRQAQQEREERNKRLNKFENVPEYPLMETDYEWFDVKSAQVSTNSSYRRREDQESQRSHSANVVTQGQLLKHNFYSTLSANNTNKIDSITARLFKQEHDPVLLGPLKARSYALGDVQQVDIPLTPSPQQELGFNVSNNPLQRIDFSSTAIRGNATPGWDVELYNDGSLQAFVTVDETGRYAFEDVQLYAGDNDFELLFFGPQGEIRRENVSIPVSSEILAQQNNVYEMAATFSEEQTYRYQDIDDPDRGAPHLSGRYNFFTGDVLNYVGFQTVSVEGEDKLFGAAGFTTQLMKTLVDGNLAMDEQGEARAGLQLRRNFGEVNMSARAEIGTDEYSENGSVDPNVFTLGYDLKAPMDFLPGRKNVLQADLLYEESADGYVSQNHGVSLASQYGDVNISNALRFRENESAGGTQTDKNFLTNIRSRFGNNKFFWRAASNYELEPEQELQNILLELKYKHNKEWSGDFKIEHEPPDSFTEYRIGANWHHENFLLSPFIEYDTEHELYTGFNLRFALVDTPDSLLPDMTSKSVIGNGFVSAFVYLDKNGDLIFNGDDEPLPGVIIKSVNVARREPTNDQGIALLSSLPAHYQTDIALDTETLPDPYMISKYEGRSVSLKPGEMIELEMPVQMVGELDGVLRMKKENGRVEDIRQARVYLEPLEKDINTRIEAQAVMDGLFVFPKIPAGRYFIVADERDTRALDAARPAPRMVSIGYDGPVFYGQDIILIEGEKDIGFGVLDEEQAFNIGLAAVGDTRQIEPRYFITVERPKASKLLNILSSFGVQKRASQYLNDLKKIETVNEKTGVKFQRYLAPGNSMAEAYARCGQIVEQGLPCRVEAAVPPSETYVLNRRGMATASKTADAAPAQNAANPI